MSELDLMKKKQRFASGTHLSSASLKRRFLKKRRWRRRRVTPEAQHEEDSDCEPCRCFIFSTSSSNRTVHRILTACLLSFLALLGSVSVDLSASLDLLRSTEAAYDELTSCRTITLLQLVKELQKMRRFFATNTSDETLDTSFPAVDRLCDEVESFSDGRGLPCSVEVSEFCQETMSHIKDVLNTSFDANSTGSALTRAIERLLDTWGSVEDSLVKAKQNSNWRDVLSARLLVVFIELNHQLMFSHHTTALSVFQLRWTRTLSYLSFARAMTERLNRCWLENMNQEMKSCVFDTSQWQISGAGSDNLSGSHTGIQVLIQTQRCLFDRASSALLSKSRSMSSSLSMRICLLALACLIYPAVMFSFKQMTEWIQNYAGRLKEKSEDLKRQRQLAEDLLHQMLPKSVAKQLRKHKHVEAESYERVTIFFSDIVGFTAISASCAPLQVVEMLNSLYMCFDTRIDSYDVYKVETIGDAYMVVSGLPERNGDRHADEIAKMALDLLAAVRQVVIPHMPNERLQLRAGIHTGPCVAGIVGYKMPRYCLFGDTVNTASRMESTSLPQKIHTSSETYLALMKDNAYELQLRGEIEVKGKGKLNTYWLVGHRNYSVQNDSLVCNWNPNMARKKKMVAGSRNDKGQLGHGDTKRLEAPKIVEGLADQVIVSAACGRNHTLALTEDGTVYSFGENKLGQLGQGSQTDAVLSPAPISYNGQPLVKVSCGAEFSMVVDCKGNLYSFGCPEYGQLGHNSDGKFIARAQRIEFDCELVPRRVAIFIEKSKDGQIMPVPNVVVRDVACGANHTLVLDSQKRVFSWGFGGYGRLGHTEQKDEMVPRLVKLFDFPGRGAAQVYAGYQCSFAINEMGALFFWGITNTSRESTMYPKAVQDLCGWKIRSLACGKSSIIIAADESTISWGPSPTCGELGYGDNKPKSSTTAQEVKTLDGIYVEQVTRTRHRFIHVRGSSAEDAFLPTNSR
ncbi:uncharacterized protein LOC119429198, partial [Nematolebias whitei]|uniref:uncharacterized protein LOC119429198 n=1 Tax=Nematolebias whitei TaxID=451745 RepID=UPI0018971768